MFNSRHRVSIALPSTFTKEHQPMKCSCCGEEAEAILETEPSGISWLCQDCSDAFFIAQMSKHTQGIEHDRQA